MNDEPRAGLNPSALPPPTCPTRRRPPRRGWPASAVVAPVAAAPPDASLPPPPPHAARKLADPSARPAAAAPRSSPRRVMRLSVQSGSGGGVGCIAELLLGGPRNVVGRRYNRRPQSQPGTFVDLRRIAV